MPPTIARDREIDQVLAVVHMWDSPAVPLIVGEPGSGKTNLLFGLSKKARSLGLQKRFLVLDVAKLITEYNLPGQAERGFCKILEELEGQPDTMLAVDGLDALLAVCSLKDAVLQRLADFRVPAVATALPAFLHVVDSPAIRRRYLPVVLEELSCEQTKQVLLALRSLLERHHHLRIPETMVELCVRLSLRKPGVLPGKSVELLDLACAELAQKRGEVLTPDDLVAAANRGGFPSEEDGNDKWETD
ncbi:MAG: hypothetical protein QHJ34_01390 [bacterium]|nr:hypothetical protein [bacterium]